MGTYNKLLCIDDDSDFLISVRIQLKDLFKITTATSLDSGLFILQTEQIDFVLLDMNIGEDNGIEGIGRIKNIQPDIDVIMLSAVRETRTVVEAIRHGATDYLTKPLDVADLASIVEGLASRRRLSERYSALVESQNASFEGGIVYKSSSVENVLKQARHLKGYKANVLIAGESGTGKELLARYIHKIEDNPARPFVAVNCAAIPQNLIEAELFGAEAGSYTGAVRKRVGKFELADQGDIFLDEVGVLKSDLQVKILRVLQEREFTRVGGNDPINADFRVIAATNEPLEEKVMRKDFRMDLYHRLRVIELSMPPLRDRLSDIPPLVEHYLKKFSRDGDVKKISPEAMEKLMCYDWPGNVRELANVIQSLSILSPSETIDASAFPAWILNGCGSADTKSSPANVSFTEAGVETLKDYISKAERRYIEFALHGCGDDRSKTAKLLGMGRTTLYCKMKSFGMV